MLNKIKSNYKIILIIVAGIIAIGVMFTLGIQGTQDKAFTLEEQVNTSMSNVKVQEKRRIDLVYNLADCVKKYSEYEAETLKNIVEQRTDNENENMGNVVNAIAENYPDLKASKEYMQLMSELSITENLIASHRSNYNNSVKEYNRYIRKFIPRTCLNILGYEKQNYEYLEYDTHDDAPQNLFGD